MVVHWQSPASCQQRHPGKTLLDRDAETKCGAGAQPWSVRYICEDLKWSKRHTLDIPRGRRWTNTVLKTGLGKGTRNSKATRITYQRRTISYIEQQTARLSMSDINGTMERVERGDPKVWTCNARCSPQRASFSITEQQVNNRAHQQKWQEHT